MATSPHEPRGPSAQLNEADTARSGGKITRARRAFRTPTPYQKPTTTTTPRISDQSDNPNWLKNLILSPSRIIASGAGKLISSVFSPSSSSESSDEEYDTDDDEENDADNLAQGTGSVQEMTDREPQQVLWKKETKKLIEQLIMQEAFSSEECDRLIRIIKSRVVDLPIVGNTRRDHNYKETPDTSSAVVMEAKKWLEEKRLGLMSNPEFNIGAGSSTPNMLPNVAQGEAGSPVDVAKSYMQARPPWASSSINHIGYTSPSPMGLQLFKEETLSSSKNKGSLISGSWSIQDEIRRLRSKATEEMLKSLPSARIDWSEVALGPKNTRSSAENPDTGTAGVAISRRIPERQDGSEEILSSGGKVKLSDSAAGAINIDGLDNGGSCQQVGSVGGGSLQEPELHEREHSLSEAVAGTKSATSANGVYTLESSISAFQDAVNNHRQTDEQNLNKAGGPVEACELLCEASLEVPFNNEQDGFVTGSQNSFNGRYDEPLQDLSQADKKVSSPGNSGGTVRRSKRKRVSTYSRGSKGQGN